MEIFGGRREGTKKTHALHALWIVHANAENTTQVQRAYIAMELDALFAFVFHRRPPTKQTV